ncbi:MAG: beta-ketoacyl-ACP reductase [Pseudomonadota bacterium]
MLEHGKGDDGSMTFTPSTDEVFSIRGKKALITGATGGIGAAIATRFHQAGAELALSGTRSARLDELTAMLGRGAHGLVCDLTHSGGAEALFEQAVAKLGGIDILINNAGVTRDQLLMRMSDEAWDQVSWLNLTVPQRLSKLVLRSMIKTRWGRIINITSIVGATGNPGQTNYAAAKAGLAGFTKSLAGELAGRAITVNCIAPGFVETAMTDELDARQKQLAMARIPLGRMGRPGEIAAAAHYLASDDAAYITGATLHINGGLSMI